ncbi:MAG: FG-GAP repeat protein [Rhodobacteraceae bacterium]|nr:FG-GAP repeat protein [Paracoccaceae bacterium]
MAEGLVDYGLGDSGPNYTNYTALGDIDGDGKGDFLIGAPGSDGDAGTVWLVTSTFLGSYDAGSDNSIDLDEALGPMPRGFMRFAIRIRGERHRGDAGAADLIGSDGAIDLVIGSPGSATNAPFFPGVTRVIDGARLLDLANSDGVIDLANLDSADADAMVSLRGTFLFPAANALAPITDFSGDAQAELGLSAPFQGRNYVITSQALEEARAPISTSTRTLPTAERAITSSFRPEALSGPPSPGRAMWMGTG